jgi:hypothetical protein
LSKILAAFRLSGSVWIEVQPFGRLVLELVALADSALDRVYRRFCANLSNISNFHHPVKPNLFLRPKPRKLIVCGLFLARESDQPGHGNSRSKASHSAKYQ